MRSRRGSRSPPSRRRRMDKIDLPFDDASLTEGDQPKDFSVTSRRGSIRRSRGPSKPARESTASGSPAADAAAQGPKPPPSRSPKPSLPKPPRNQPPNRPARAPGHAGREVAATRAALQCQNVSLREPVELVVEPAESGWRLDVFPRPPFPRLQPRPSPPRDHRRRRLHRRPRGQAELPPQTRPGPGDPARDPRGAPRRGDPLQVLYEDGWLAVVNKPPGMVVHPAATGRVRWPRRYSTASPAS